MSDAMRIVQQLSNVQSISLLKQLNQNVLAAVSPDEMASHLPRDVVQVEELQALDAETRRRKLDPTTSVQAARDVLAAFAADAELAPMVVQAWDEIREDDTQMVEAIIAVGLIANLTLFMATTAFKFRSKNLVIDKGRADAKMIREAFTPFAAVLKKLTVAS